MSIQHSCQKFKFGSFSILLFYEILGATKLPLSRMKLVIEFRSLPTENGFNIKNEFDVHNRSLRPKTDLLSS